MSGNSPDPEKNFYFAFTKVNKVIFDNVTRLTLAGFIGQVGVTVDNVTIMVISGFLYFLVTFNAFLDVFFLSDHVSSYLRSKGIELWVKWLLMIFFIVVVMSVYWMFISPAMNDVFDYYFSVAKK